MARIRSAATTLGQWLEIQIWRRKIGLKDTIATGDFPGRRFFIKTRKALKMSASMFSHPEHLNEIITQDSLLTYARNF